MTVEVRVLPDSGAALAALKDLVAWAETLDLAYAWASAGRSADHWKALPLERIRRAIIGIHFAQTEPSVLRALHELGVLRVMADTSGVFHPKLLIGVARGKARAIIGSSNLTDGGFSGNTELNVLLSGPSMHTEFRRLLGLIEEWWTHPRAREPDEDWFAEYQELYLRRPPPPRAPVPTSRLNVVDDAVDVDVEWPAFVDLVGRQERRTLWTGLKIHVFDHPEGSYLQEVEACQAAFAREPRFARMPADDRKLVAGWGDRTAGYYGSMKGAGYFKNLTRERPSALARHLDRVPLNGRITLDNVSAYLEGVMSLEGVRLGTATRLLSVKRPDRCLPANNASIPSINRVFGSSPNTIEKYLALLERIWNFPWANATMPSDVAGQRIWRARVALLDAVFYVPPPYVA